MLAYVMSKTLIVFKVRRSFIFKCCNIFYQLASGFICAPIASIVRMREGELRCVIVGVSPAVSPAAEAEARRGILWPGRLFQRMILKESSCLRPQSTNHIVLYMGYLPHKKTSRLHRPVEPHQIACLPTVILSVCKV